MVGYSIHCKSQLSDKLRWLLNFKNAFQGNYTSTKNWDINQLRAEQKLLQPIHEKYLLDYPTFRYVTEKMTGVTILNYDSRIEFGCNGMGYSKAQGCTP